MKTREEQLQEWRERRGIHRGVLRPKSVNELSSTLTAAPGIGSQQGDIQPSLKQAASSANVVHIDGDKENYDASEGEKVVGAGDKGSRRSIAGAAFARPTSRVPNFMAPTQSSIRQARSDGPTLDDPALSDPAWRMQTSGIPRDSISALGLRQEMGGVGFLLRERMSILRRESAAPNAAMDMSFSRGTVADPEIHGPGDLKLPCLETLGKELFETPDMRESCEKALTWQLKSSKEGATKDSRISELADLTKLARRILKQLMSNSLQFMGAAVTVQRQMEQEIEGLRLQQMSANSAHEAVKAELARQEAELAQVQNNHKQQNVEMRLENERLDSEIKRLSRAIENLEREKRDTAAAKDDAESALELLSKSKAELETALETANRQRDQSLNAAAAARDVEMAATARAREVEAAATDAIRRANQAESKASIAEASMQAAELREEAMRKLLQAKENEVETLTSEQAKILESSQAVLKDYEELQDTCSRVLNDLNMKTASLEAVNNQLCKEEEQKNVLVEQVATQRKEISNLQDQNYKLKADLEVKSSSLERLSKQLTQQTDKCGTLEGEIGQLRNTLAEAAVRESALEGSVSSLQHHLSTSVASMNAAKAEFESKISSLLAEKKDLESALCQSHLSESNAQEEIVSLKQCIEDADAETEQLNAELSQQQEELLALKSHAEEKASRLARLESEMEALREVAGIAAEGGNEGDMVSALLGRVAALEAAALAAHKERRELHNALVDLRGNIRVFCRVRPVDESTPSAVKAEGQSVKLLTSRGGKPSTFNFDKVFGPSANQESVFGEVSDLVQSALDGYNVCLFSYGQTGAGKTHTMQGSQTMEGRGIIPRAVSKLLSAIQNLRAQGWEYSLEASFVEIYNETIRDLLQPQGSASAAPAGGLSIQHNAEGGTAVLGAVRVPVDSLADSDTLITRANRARAVEATAMNAASSRSHSIFMLYCTGSNVEAGVRLSGVLNLVDLAGSERLNRSKAEGARQREACAINKSLSSLGDVFSALASKAGHIPYRNSKLTHLLQPCLGGDGKTLMFVNINPEEASADETLCSLKFAAQVSQCETMARGGAKRHVSNITTGAPKELIPVSAIDPSAVSQAVSRHPIGPSQRRDSLTGNSSRRDSLTLNSRSRVPLKRKTSVVIK